jgi:hypothetical protein
MYEINNFMIPAQRDFGKGHPGWGREYRKALFYGVEYKNTQKADPILSFF